MSTDGPGLFADDTAHDVRAEFTELLSEARDADRATDELIARWGEFIASADQGDVFWLALAAAQVRFGCLRDDVRDRALRVIDEGSDLRRWEVLPEYRERAAVLRRLRAQLMGPQRPAKLPARRRRREPPTIDLESPDGSRLARAFQLGSPRGHTISTNVFIFSGANGVSAIQVECRLDQVAMAWRGNSELEITYPIDARVLHRHREVSNGAVITLVSYERRS